MGHFVVKLIKLMVGITEKKQWFTKHFKFCMPCFPLCCIFWSIEHIFSNYSFIKINLEMGLDYKLLAVAYKMLNSKDKNLGPEAYEDY